MNPPGSKTGKPVERNLEEDEMPNFFVIGAAKCGTSSLHEYLDLHPEISMSDIKEPRYFLRHVEGVQQPVVRELTAYLSLFKSGTKMRGESSVGYSSWPAIDGVPKAIAAEVEDPRFVYLVRDPIEMTVSGIRQMQSDSWFSKDEGGTGVSLESVLRAAQDPLRSRILASGMFMTQVEQYLKAFSRESLLIVDSDQLRLRRVETLREIFSFLGVEKEFDCDGFHSEFNSGSDLRRKSDFYRSLVRVRWLRHLVYRLPRGFRRRVVAAASRPLSAPIERPVLTKSSRAALAEVFHPEVEALRCFSGNGFPTWSL